ncbi:hypothetical protein AWB74_06732 [Caballeronia arvi]|uniref:Uncharacterized protein n=1 Tax=Caballeronia arvi TaxID=1777135 RepID=A0A158KRS8_9BURK|nr:hypothetical protein AWB74_06732 [Caballeronia arvi]
MPSTPPATPSSAPSSMICRTSAARVMPSTRSIANCARRRTTPAACVENTRNAPVKSATSASTFMLMRYARDRRSVRLSTSLVSVTTSRPPSSRCSVRRNASRSTPRASCRSTRDSLPVIEKCVCTAAMSITAMRCPGRVRAMPPATRSFTFDVPLCSSTDAPSRAPSHASAAGERKMAS